MLFNPNTHNCHNLGFQVDSHQGKSTHVGMEPELCLWSGLDTRQALVEKRKAYPGDTAGCLAAHVPPPHTQSPMRLICASTAGHQHPGCSFHPRDMNNVESPPQGPGSSLCISNFN